MALAAERDVDGVDLRAQLSRVAMALVDGGRDDTGRQAVSDPAQRVGSGLRSGF